MTENENTSNDRPIEYWLHMADRLVAAGFAQAFAAEGVARHEWRTLRDLADAPAVPAAYGRSAGRLQNLVARGWVAVIDGAWALTDAGTAALERLDGVADGVRERIAAAVAAADTHEMGAQLEAIARELGWNESLEGAGFGRPGFRPWGRGGHGRGRYAAFGERESAGYGPVPAAFAAGFAGRGGRGFAADPSGFGPGFRGFGRGLGGAGRGGNGDGRGSRGGYAPAGPVDPAFDPAACGPSGAGAYAGRRGGHRGGRRGFGPAF